MFSSSFPFANKENKIKYEILLLVVFVRQMRYYGINEYLVKCRCTSEFVVDRGTSYGFFTAYYSKKPYGSPDGKI